MEITVKHAVTRQQNKFIVLVVHLLPRNVLHKTLHDLRAHHKHGYNVHGTGVMMAVDLYHIVYGLISILYLD